MADGSSGLSKVKVLQAYDAVCPTFATLAEGQVVVGCCCRCGSVGEVDAAGWRATPRDWVQKLCVVQGQTACDACLCRYVVLQVWPAPPYADSRPAFSRWR